jgi:hypothetical protein
MQLRLLAPAVVDFGSVPGASVRDPDRYARFWATQQAAVDRLVPRLVPPGMSADGPVITLQHTRRTSSLNRYRVIDDHAVDVPLHVLSASLRPEHLPAAFAGEAAVLRSGVREISLRLYDHGLVFIEVLVDLTDWTHVPAGPLQERLDRLQATAVELGAAVARECVGRYLDPLLDRLRAVDRDGAVLLPAGPPTSATVAGSGQVLWVTRALVLDPGDEATPDIVRHWSKDVGPLSSEDKEPVERLLAGETDRLARWLNHVYLDASPSGATMAPGERFADNWEALRYAQLFYGSLELIDTRLSKILADATVAPARWQLGQLQEQLTELSQRAELIIMERQSLSKYLKRSVRVEMDELIDYWEYEELIEAPVRFKVAMCDRRLAELASRRTARSSLFTDLILLGIGVTSVLATALALTEFGRTMASSPGMARYDLGHNSLTAWFASQPADAVLLASAAVSALLVALFLFFRRDHRR